MIRYGFPFALIAALSLSACDASSPTADQEPESEAVLEQLAVAALEAADQEGFPNPTTISSCSIPTRD